MSAISKMRKWGCFCDSPPFSRSLANSPTKDCLRSCGRCYAKRSLMSWVIAIPKEGRARLLVWHRLRTLGTFSRNTSHVSTPALKLCQRFICLHFCKAEQFFAHSFTSLSPAFCHHYVINSEEAVLFWSALPFQAFPCIYISSLYDFLPQMHN